MSKPYVVLIVVLLLTFFLRVYPLGGLSKQSQDPELEQIASTFVPLRNSLSDKIGELLPVPQSALLSGMLLGVQSELPADFKNSLRKTSTIHIVVVSGQNLTLVAGFIMSFAPFLGRKKTLIVALFVSIFYSFLTGLQVPIIRAAIMVLFAMLAQAFNRENQSPRILILTATLMLIFNPNWLYSVSFQLSFLATAGVVILSPELVKKFTIVPTILRQDLAVSIAATSLTWPVIAANFHNVSIIGVFVNSLVLWTVSFIMISGALALIVGFLNLFLGQIAMLFAGVLLTYFVYIISFFGNLPLASVYIGKISPLVWIGYYFIVLSIFL